MRSTKNVQYSGKSSASCTGQDEHRKNLKIKLIVPEKRSVNQRTKEEDPLADSVRKGTNAGCTKCRGVETFGICTFHRDICSSFKENLSRSIDERMEQWTLKQDTESEFLRIRGDDSIEEAKAEIRVYVDECIGKLEGVVENAIIDFTEEDKNLEWAIQKQLRDFRDLLQNQQKILMQLDELSAKGNSVVGSIQPHLMQKSIFEELYPEEHAALNIPIYRGWRRRDGPKKSFKEWVADPAEAMHRPPPISISIISRDKRLPQVVIQDIDDVIEENDNPKSSIPRSTERPVSSRKRLIPASRAPSSPRAKRQKMAD